MELMKYSRNTVRLKFKIREDFEKGIDDTKNLLHLIQNSLDNVSSKNYSFKPWFAFSSIHIK